jgi:two-component system, NtrC family, response regulator HydG
VRIPRLLTILGPASVLYVLAARASSNPPSSPEWLVAVLSIVLSLTPLALLGARPGTRGASGLALMGVALGVALASARTGSPVLERTHDLAWLIVGLVILDLVLPRATRALVRYGALGGFAAAALVSGGLAQAGLVPVTAFGVVVLAAVLAAGALHQIVLVERGHGVEGVLSGIALVTLAVGLAYSWFGRSGGLLATTIEFTVASLLWLGHLAWVDPRWRSLGRAGVPVVAACTACFSVMFAFAPADSMERWQLGLLALTSGVLWWLTFSFARKLSNHAVWSTTGRLVDGVQAATHNLFGRTALEDVALGVLVPLAQALGSGNGLPELYTLEPPLRIRLDDGERVTVKSADAPAPVTRALFVDAHDRVLDLLRLRGRVVREPSIRALVDAMESRAIGCVLPCVHLDHTEGLLLLPLSERSETFSHPELEALARLGDLLGVALATTLSRRRADSQIRELSVQRRDAEDRIVLLQEQIEQLRRQCDVVGRSLAEDQTLHVAYSQSMRRVQTRAIELATVLDPILLVAPTGSPVLPVCRFIHDRGPRWEAPFVVADCSAAPPDQVMSLLFGAEGARRTGWLQSATDGTLLLRDLPALLKPAQRRLAAALAVQDTPSEDDHAPLPARPRIIATSRAPLSELRASGALEPELASCFSQPVLTIPLLRERREDIPSLVLLAIDRACRMLAREPIGIEQEAMRTLVAHVWPGDVAELEIVIELAVAATSGKTISLRHLPSLAWPGADEGESLSGTYLEVEKRLLERALLRSGGNKSEAARMLGLKRTTFLDKLRRHGLEQRGPRDVSGSAVG